MAVLPFLWIYAEISGFFRILDIFSLAIFKQHGSQWYVVLHGISFGLMLFENTVKFLS